MANIRRRVVVTGLGAITPIGNDIPSFWQNLLLGKSGAAKLSMDLTDMDVQIGCEVKSFDPTRFMDPKLVRRTDRFTQFALGAAAQALQDARLDLAQEDPTRVGVIVGSGMGGILTWEAQFAQYLAKGPKRVSPLLIPMMIPDMAGGQIAITYGLRGPNYTTTSACASGAHAASVAFRHIVRGDADVMITGGTEAAISRFTVAAFANMGALSRRNHEPEKASRPFDRGRDGFVIAEGAGICVLEELSHAQARGADIYCELAGYGATADAYHITAPDPEAQGACEVMRQALADAGLRPQDIDYINAHGTSTPHGDRIETVAIKRVFGEHAYKLAVSSTKSATGHLLGAAGGLETGITALAVARDTLPPTLNLDNPDEGCDLDYVPHRARKQPVRVALSNSFGFGGTNACIVLGKLES